MDYLRSKFIIEHYKLLGEPDRMPIEIPHYRREEMGNLYRELGFTEGAEVGVHAGAFSDALLKVNPALHMNCIDPWIVYPDYTEFFRQAEMDSHFEDAKRKLSPYNVTFIRKTSMNALEDIPDNSLDFVYIDANHAYAYVLEDLRGWGKKVKTGGIISGHDYAHLQPEYKEIHHDFRVVEAVDDYIKEMNVKCWFLYARMHEERYRSFMIEKVW